MFSSYIKYKIKDVKKKTQNEKILLQGWVHRIRNHGSLFFIDLRDHSDIIQLVYDTSTNKKLIPIVEGLRAESVISVYGNIIERTANTINKNINTGNIEFRVDHIEINNKSKPLPFQINDDMQIDEELRLKYRYLDMRKPYMQKNIKIRHEIVFFIRDFMNKNEFLEIETPILTKNTPEGAREFIVPTRLDGKFFALPQSPQLYKQLLMASGFDKYFQIAKCFRDEDLRADRQFEFTQLDIEMSFINEIDIQNLIENILKLIFHKFLHIDIKTPFLRMPYKEAFESYGCDKPDLRFDLKIKNITNLFLNTKIDFLKKVIESEGEVGCILVNEKQFSRSELDHFVEHALQNGAKGLLWMKINDKNLIDSPISKFLPNNFIEQIKNYYPYIKSGDTLFIMAGKYKETWTHLGRLRLYIGKTINIMNPDDYKFLWVTDFPLFEYESENKTWNAVHHPFTRPNKKDFNNTEIGDLTAVAYDIVLNGIELGGGSMRIYEKSLQERIFDIIGLDKTLAEKKFGFLLEAQDYGFPPHGGIALGLDRLIMLIVKAQSIRDIIAFPKTPSGDPLMDGPSIIEDAFLKEYKINRIKS